MFVKRYFVKLARYNMKVSRYFSFNAKVSNVIFLGWQQCVCVWVCVCGSLCPAESKHHASVIVTCTIVVSCTFSVTISTSISKTLEIFISCHFTWQFFFYGVTSGCWPVVVYLDKGWCHENESITLKKKWFVFLSVKFKNIVVWVKNHEVIICVV